MSEALRPRIGVNKDTQFYWDGLKQGKLLIQRCNDCGALQHPPGPCCKHCQSFDLAPIEASGNGTVHALVRMHHPMPPPFVKGQPIALVELEEGTRLVAELINYGDREPSIGDDVKVAITRCDDDVTLAFFEPA